MRDVMDCIKKYVEVMNDEKFIAHWKNLSTKLLMGIRNGYIENYREENIVKTIENIVNSIKRFKTQDRKFSISTNSIFIHGHKSQVEFEYYGSATQRELGLEF